LASQRSGFRKTWTLSTCEHSMDTLGMILIHRSADPTVSPSMFVQELWLCMLGRTLTLFPSFGSFIYTESVNIPCHDHRGRRRIPWLQLPMFLAHRRGFIAGCPLECHPKVEDDVVLEISGPNFWDEQQIRLMADAFVKNNVSVCSRKPSESIATFL
jgi:hypothetical protein